MLKLFKPKKRLIISDIKIPIPMLAGIENATNMTEEQIELFLRGGKLNVPVEQQKRNMLPVILNEKIKSDESSSDTDYSDSENEDDIIMELRNKMSKEVQQKNEQSLKIQDQPYASSIPVTENQNTETVDPSTAMKKPQKPPIIQQEPIKNESSPQKIDSSNSSTLNVVPTLQKQQLSEKARAEQYQEKIISFKYQLEQLEQLHSNEYQAHLNFVKETESKYQHAQHQIRLVEQKLDEIRHRRSMPRPQNEEKQLRTCRSYHALTRDDPVINPHNTEQQRPSMYSLETEEDDKEGVVTHKQSYDDYYTRQRWMKAYQRYCDYWYYYYYYNDKNRKGKTNDHYRDGGYYPSRNKPHIPYYGTKKGGVDGKGETAYQQYRTW